MNYKYIFKYLCLVQSPYQWLSVMKAELFVFLYVFYLVFLLFHKSKFVSKSNIIITTIKNNNNMIIVFRSFFMRAKNAIHKFSLKNVCANDQLQMTCFLVTCKYPNMIEMIYLKESMLIKPMNHIKMYYFQLALLS